MKTNRPKRPAWRVGALVGSIGIAALVAVAAGSARSSAVPINVTKPTITGPAVVGGDLVGSRGAWSGTKITYKYQWLQCKPEPTDDSSSATCRNITGATAIAYRVGSDDLDKRIRFRVFAKNSSGTTQATSAPTSVITSPGEKPAVTAPPVISGSALVGQTLTTGTGTWVGDKPITYAFKWLRCNKEGDACTATGKTKATYKVVNADVGKTLRTRVIASNSRGQSDAYSAPTAVVQEGGSGIITLPNGEKSVDAKEVPKDQRLVVATVIFSPNPVTSKTAPILAQIKVKDTRGYVVRNAIVFIRSTPKVTSGGDNLPTATDGWVSYQLFPEDDFPVKNGYNVQFFVKAYRKGDPSKGGVYGSALVQVATRQP
jgi:hypothetical protein